MSRHGEQAAIAVAAFLGERAQQNGGEVGCLTAGSESSRQEQSKISSQSNCAPRTKQRQQVAAKWQELLCEMLAAASQPIYPFLLMVALGGRAKILLFLHK
jgi:hypothetical protein